MPTRKRLGKGLGALLGETAVEAVRSDREVPGSGVLEVEVTRISPNRFQPRHTFHEASIEELAASIAEQGVLQPLIVTPRDGGFELVTGERRWRAAQRAGLRTVPVVVREVDERELLEIALVENLQREDLDAIDEAEGYRQLVEEFRLTQSELARRVGKSRPAIANALRLLDLPDEVRGWVREGALSAGHGRALLGLDDRSGLVGLARETARRGWSVRQLERRVRRENGGPSRARKEEDPATARERVRLEEELQRALGTRVRLHADGRGKGRIEIQFYSFEDLDRLVGRLKGESR